MANYQLLKADIDAKVYENARRKITGANLNSVLNAMVTTLGTGYQFAGVATIATNPGTPDAKVFYIANGKGTYEKFGGLEVTEDDVVVLYYDTAWHKVSTGIASQAKLSELEEKVANAVSITYAELKSLRDAGKLVPGQQYRITDYTCTTTQDGTKSAGHQFDIIVTADDESTLNEVARAALHTGDTYFANSNLSAWQIWYCLDNDINRFTWADKTNGKGVIYRMIDEWNNDVPYDFKNIQYNGSWGYWAYTFNWINDKSDNSCEDLSVAQYVHTNIEGGYSHTCGNVINPCELIEDGNYGYPLKLNVCVFLNTETYDSGLFYGCSSNSFGNNCYENTFGNDCNGNSFGNDCNGNSFGNNCRNNAFGDSCYGNAFGNDCNNNAFGNYCSHNAFGNDCYSNSFGDSCSCIKFASDSYASTKYNYYQFNHFGDGCQYIVFTGTEIASLSARVQNYNFAQGLRGTYVVYLTIDGKRNLAYETKVAKNSNGEIKTYCEADLIL